MLEQIDKIIGMGKFMLPADLKERESRELTEEELKSIKEKDCIEEAVEVIKSGRIVAFPTETVYGIGVNCFDKNAIKRLFEVKKRPYNKPISVLVSNINMINKVAKDISKEEQKIIQKFFPGPLTIILNKNEKVPNILTNNQNDIGIRMPSEKKALELIEKSQVPIATSSANITGEECNLDIKSVKNIFKQKVDYYIDGGKSKIGIASTVIKMVDGEVKILREGSITKEQILTALEE